MAGSCCGTGVCMGDDMTEDEARQKWCPFSSYDPIMAARAIGPEGCPGAYCIASDCHLYLWVPDNEYTLTNGLVVITDVADNFPEEFIGWDGRYATYQGMRLHRYIAKDAHGSIPDGYEVDHIDGDVLNNRRGNLRIVTHQQNIANSAPRGGKSQYRGVYKNKQGKWQAQLSSRGVRWSLGVFDSEDEAAKAYDERAKEVHGEFARLNLEPKTNSGRHGYCGLVK